MTTHPHTNLVTLFNSSRAETEGDLPAAHKRVNAIRIPQGETEVALPQPVIEYIALTTDWRNYQFAFWGLCKQIIGDSSLAICWQAMACESLGATHPQNKDKPELQVQRLAYFSQAEDMVAGLPADDDVRIYIETCVAAGRNETVGTTPNLSVFSQVAAVMVAKRWFNAPGRLKALLDYLVQGEHAVTDETLALIEEFKLAEDEGDHAFSPRQTGFLKKAHPSFFHAAA